MPLNCYLNLVWNVNKIIMIMNVKESSLQIYQTLCANLTKGLNNHVPPSTLLFLDVAGIPGRSFGLSKERVEIQFLQCLSVGHCF